MKKGTGGPLNWDSIGVLSGLIWVLSPLSPRSIGVLSGFQLGFNWGSLPVQFGFSPRFLLVPLGFLRGFNWGLTEFQDASNAAERTRFTWTFAADFMRVST